MNKILILPMLLLSLLLLSACSSEENSTTEFDYAEIALYEKTVTDTGVEASVPVRELFISCRASSKTPEDCRSLALLPEYQIKERGQKADLLGSAGECAENPERDRRVLVKGQINGQKIYQWVDLECSPERQAAFKELFPKLLSGISTEQAKSGDSGSCGGQDAEAGRPDSGCLQVSGASFK